MMADIMTKPLTGNLFRKLRDLLLNVTWAFPSSYNSFSLLHAEHLSSIPSTNISPPRPEHSRHGPTRLHNSPTDFHQFQSTTDTPTDRDSFFLQVFLCKESLLPVHTHIHQSVPLLLTSFFYLRFSKIFLLPFPTKTFLWPRHPFLLITLLLSTYHTIV
jgi:hypothetical protein